MARQIAECVGLDDPEGDGPDDVVAALYRLVNLAAELERAGISPADICAAQAIALRLSEIELYAYAAPATIQ